MEQIRVHRCYTGITAGNSHLNKGMEEAEAKEQLLEGCGLLATVEESGITDWIIQVALHQVCSQALQAQMSKM